MIRHAEKIWVSIGAGFMGFVVLPSASYTFPVP